MNGLKAMLESGGNTSNELLRSWKDIASYLGVTERTARRWQRERGLPVRKEIGGRRSTVFAYRREIDEWLVREGNPESARGDGKTGGGATAAAETAGSLQDTVPGTSAVQQAPSALRFVSQRARPMIVMALVTAGLGGAFLRLALPSEDLAKVDLSGTQLIGRDAVGKAIWRMSLPGPVKPIEAVLDQLGRPLSNTVHVADLNGDGTVEALVLASYQVPEAASTPDQELLHVSHKGRLVWRWKPKIIVRQGETEFGGPWVFHAVKLRPKEGGGHEVWVVLNHPRWRPGLVLTLDDKGSETLRFLNSGHIYALAFWSHEGVPYVMAGGVNNEYAAASLAILGVDAPPASSPQTQGSDFDGRATAASHPLAYFLIAPLDVNLAEEPFNRVDSISVEAEGLLVQTHESQRASAYYRFSSPFNPVGVTFDNTFVVEHLRLERGGLLSHPARLCPHLNRGNRIRAFRAPDGWREIPIPAWSGVLPNHSHLATFPRASGGSQ